MYFITISRKMGTNGHAIAQRVADQLGYKLYDTEAIESAAREMGFLEDFKNADEKAPSLFKKLYSHQPEVHLDRLQSVIYELASRGNALFLGRGSHILLRNFKCALQIRVTASLEKRVQNMVERGCLREAAVRAIAKSDREREAFIRYAFGQDWESPELYDVVINMDYLTVDFAVDAILHMAGSEEIKACSVDALQSLEMMGLSRRAEAALIGADFGISSSSVSVTVVGPGKVELAGIVSEQAKKTEAARILQNVKGVKSVDNQIRVVSINRGL
ncbi:MAG: cytidylate kinase family protein [Deltaproteobacteria bacterium]|nr:cytidylate kinase family protein [Deltaproteobacteria bacterium]